LQCRDVQGIAHLPEPEETIPCELLQFLIAQRRRVNSSSLLLLLLLLLRRRRLLLRPPALLDHRRCVDYPLDISWLRIHVDLDSDHRRAAGQRVVVEQGARALPERFQLLRHQLVGVIHALSAVATGIRSDAGADGGVAAVQAHNNLDRDEVGNLRGLACVPRHSVEEKHSATVAAYVMLLDERLQDTSDDSNVAVLQQRPSLEHIADSANLRRAQTQAVVRRHHCSQSLAEVEVLAGSAAEAVLLGELAERGLARARGPDEQRRRHAHHQAGRRRTADCC
jgi:hypothetical protein